MEILGIDIGGSGIKGAVVDIEKGELTTERCRIPTPQPAIPDTVGDVVAEIVAHFSWSGQPVGCTFPAIVKDGLVLNAPNVDNSWIGVNGQELIAKKIDCPVLMINDADAAGIAEMEFGAGKGHSGLVIMLTLGTGIGSAIFINGQLIPNTEFGHLEIRGKDAEDRASARNRKENGLSWKKWSGYLNEFLGQMELLFSPDLFIIGGGISKKHEKFLPLLQTRAEIVPAQLRNEAGIIGVALATKMFAR